MSNKPDSTAADMADILKRRGALHIIQGHNFYTEESVISAMTEFAQKEKEKEAQQFAEFAGNIWRYNPAVKSWWRIDGMNRATTAELYEEFKRYKEGKG